MQWDWPADVTYYESKAYCLWKSERDGPSKNGPLRVLTEAEHNVIRHQDHNLDAARSNVDADKVMVTSGSNFPRGDTGANLNMAYSSQNPVNFFPPSHTGHFDTVGNAWEWTEDHFNPLKNFEVHHVYDDFSTPCFDAKHFLQLGGSYMGDRLRDLMHFSRAEGPTEIELLPALKALVELMLRCVYQRAA